MMMMVTMCNVHASLTCEQVCVCHSRDSFCIDLIQWGRVDCFCVGGGVWTTLTERCKERCRNIGYSEKLKKFMKKIGQNFFKKSSRKISRNNLEQSKAESLN